MSGKKFDIFLSYQWDKKKEVLELYPKLTNELNYRVWMDDHLLVATESLYDQLARGLNESNCVVACVTEKYCHSENCKLELEFAQTHNLPVICLMLEKLALNEVGSIGLLINRKMTLNFYKNQTDLWSGDRFEGLIKAVNKTIGRDSDLPSMQNIISLSNMNNNVVNITINQAEIRVSCFRRLLDSKLKKY